MFEKTLMIKSIINQNIKITSGEITPEKLGIDVVPLMPSYQKQTEHEDKA